MLELLKVSISKHAVLKIDLRPEPSRCAGQRLTDPPNRDEPGYQCVRSNWRERRRNQGHHIAHILAPRSNLNSHRLSPGDYLTLEVSDTGGGMTEEVQAKIFDPFFSTKFAGRGLGLAVVQGIVRDHGGAINLVSAPGQGTRFEIFLPCVAGTAPWATPLSRASPWRSTGPGRDCSDCGG